ncbi:MAG: ribonuclease III [Candidatus Eisenbacteria bacterium]|nr:ribonuclease III [Candidatus Eisenbacteria bacterium]
MSLGEQEARAISEFCRHYRIVFRDPALLKLALTHRSYLSVTGQGPRESNERLEFLGDSVLGLVTSEYLYRQNPNEHEGQLTKTKSLLVSKAILSRRALAMGLGRFVLMSHSEVESGGRQRLSILADGFESVVGAIYLDQGFEAARSFIERWLLRESREIVADKRHTNYKSHLQEYVQSTFRTHPVYRIRSQMGPDHSKQFLVEVVVGKRVLGEGKGRNKKEAEQAAARDALEKVEAANPREIERAALDTGQLETLTTGEGDADEAAPGRRRRGRRGGRGRRSQAGGDAPTESGRTEVARVEAPRAEAPRIEVARSEVRRAEPRRPEPPAAAAPATEPPELDEIEPLPPAYEEDENEEVGRPEGPLEERHVDPFGFETPVAAPMPVEDEPAEVEDRPDEHLEFGAEAEDDDVETAAEAPWAAPGEPEPPTGSRREEAPPGTGADAPRFGRRPGRTRRGR